MAESVKEIVMLSTSEIKPYDRNPRKNDQAVDAVAKSIQSYGFKQPILVDRDNVIICGHTRWKAAKRLRIQKVPCCYADDLTPEQVREYRIADNSTGEVAEWDLPLLKLELDDLPGFDADSFGLDLSWLNETGEEEEPDEAVDDEFEPEPPEVPASKPGQIYQLGRHRLMCGDSTKTEDVQKLCNGAKIDLLITDPPYNVDYHGTAGTIENDNFESAEAFLQFLCDAFTAGASVLKPGAAYYIWHADSEGENFRRAAREKLGKVRQTLIWKKSSLVLGRQDYQWIHEPCQPAGTMILTPKGMVPIEELRDGDRVISFDTYSGCVKGYHNGLAIKTASRWYDGILYGINAAGRETWATDNHEFSVRFNPETAQTWSTYLMVNDKGWWRVGVTRTYDARGFGLKHRFKQENAEAAWIVETFESQADAQMGEQLLACRYGIPYTHWNIKRGQTHDEYNHRTEKQIDWLYSNMNLSEMRRSAERLLSDFGRSINYPLVTERTKMANYSRRVTARINACNIIPGLMMVPIPKEHYEGTDTFRWAVIDGVNHKEHHGPVYSLAVAKFHHYIADGIVTHNCLYGWTDGGSHYWGSDRKQTTVMEFDKPRASKEHPTMKPIPLFDYQIRNSAAMGERCLDLFGGSGTTIMACEQNKRIAYVMEYDPKYVDVIIKRWEEFTGQKAELINE